MVVDRLENIEKYASLNPLFAQAIEFLKSHDLNALEVGKTELKGKDLLVCCTVPFQVASQSCFSHWHWHR